MPKSTRRCIEIVLHCSGAAAQSSSGIFLSVCLDALFENFPWFAPTQLKQFFEEVQNENGNEYSPKTLYDLATTVQTFLNVKNIKVKIFKDKVFDGFRGALDSKMKFWTKTGTYEKKVRQG